MRIVCLIHRYWPSVGGVERFIHELTAALVTMGHEIDVVAGDTTGGLPTRETHTGVVIHRFPALRSAMRCRWWFLQQRALFARADVVHVSNTHMLEYYRRIAWPFVRRRKVFLTRHGMSFRFPVPESDRRRARRAQRFVVGVAHDGAFIGKWLGVTPDFCVQQGLRPEADAIAQVQTPPPTSAVYVGRLEPDTGIRTYVEAVRILQAEYGMPFSLDVYGDGTLGPQLRAIVQRHDLSVRFHGSVSDAQDRIQDASFAFVDGRMAIQEAFARRRLVLAAYDHDLKRDYVCGESFSPFLVATRTPAELAERVVYYVEHEAARDAKVNRAFEHARTLSWTRVAEAYVELWRDRLRVHDTQRNAPAATAPARLA